MLKIIKTLLKKPKPTGIELNRTKHKKLKKVWDSTKSLTGGSLIELQEAYYDSQSNIYYTHKNITDFHISRQFVFNKSMQGIEWGLTTKVLTRRLDQIEVSLQGDEAAREQGLRQVNDLKLRIKRIPEKEMFLELAMCLIYRHDENPYIFEPALRTRKLRDMLRDPNLESFFLSEAWVHSKGFLNQDKLADYKIQSSQDFQDYFDKKIIEAITSSTNTI